MIQQLIILGLLKGSPLSGYDIKKFINTELGVFAKIQTQSIYYQLKKMEKEGLIKRRERATRKHVKKFIYSVTPKGERQFLNLCKEVLLSQRRPFIELDVALYFLPLLDTKKIMPLLRLRLRFLESVKKWLIAKEKEQRGGTQENLALLLRHHLGLATAEKEFLQNMIEIIRKND